jgi:hypothetical protein
MADYFGGALLLHPVSGPFDEAPAWPDDTEKSRPFTGLPLPCPRPYGPVEEPETGAGNAYS